MEELIDMNLRQTIFGFSAWVVVMLSLPCNSFALEDKVAAKIGNEKIMKSDIMRIVSYQDPDKQRLMEQNPQFKVSLLTRMVNGRVISAIAREKGFDKKPFIKDQLEILVNEFLTAEYIKREVIEKIEVTEEDMKLYYKTREAEFKTPETARASQILIRVDNSATTEEKAKSREKIADVLKRIKAGEEFSKLASEIIRGYRHQNQGR
jgi:peptidyl-prolyl cis-trans isomerase C